MAVDERRVSYRVSEGLDGVRIAVPVAGQEDVEARLLDLTARGASIALSVSTSEIPPLPAGTEVYLSFAIPGLSELTGVLSLVRNERIVGNQRIIGLEIAESEELETTLPSRLFALFNRRRHRRIDLQTDQPVPVSVRLEGDVAISARLADISTSGCGLLLETGRDLELGNDICLSFQLPDGNYPYHLGGVVRTRSRVGTAIRCGIEFGKSDSPGYIEQEQNITSFVMQRLDAVLRSEEPLIQGANS